jgi:hypothetical protein
MVVKVKNYNKVKLFKIAHLNLREMQKNGIKGLNWLL